ncbi:MAG: hypothetical protein O7B30_04265 [Thaumarchaeota archaeon]|nr:hypothetical protein [Nitrososphaerota archaeon]
MANSATFLARVISDGRITIPNEVRSLLGIEDDIFLSCTVTLSSNISRDIEERRRDTPLLADFARVLEQCRPVLEVKGPNGIRRSASYLKFLVGEGLVEKEIRDEMTRYRTTHAGNLLLAKLGGVDFE